jgi:hypothetical protein
MEDALMEHDRGLSTVVASSLLGVISMAAVVSAAFVLFGAWVAGRGDTGLAIGVGVAGAALVGVLLLGFGILAGLAARDTFRNRARGAVLGLVTSITAILAATAALLEGSTTTAEVLLYIAIGLGVAALAAVIVNAITHREQAAVTG